MKDIKTNLAGKIRNLPHFRSEALLPVFEAVINAIQAVEEKGNLATGQIVIEIQREPQQMLNEAESSAITGFTISDNGIGFTEANFDSFQTSDSIHKLSKGGKGIGRFLWLKAFKEVEVNSVFNQNRKTLRRQFKFSVENGIGDGVPVATTEPEGTKVRLVGFKKEYRALASAYKTTQKIAQRILEHCLSYFVAGGAPRITVRDDKEQIVLNEVYNRDFKDNITQSERILNGHKFDLTHIKLYSTHDRMHNIVLCANRRDVKPLSLAKALGTSTQFDDSDRRFTYALYVTSQYLDEHADHYRLDFDLPENETLLGDTDGVSMSELVAAVSGAAKEFLSDYLAKTRSRKEQRVASYVAAENPALRAVPTYCPEVYDEIEPTSTPERIDEVLYHFKGKAEFAIRKESAALLKTQANSLSEIDASYAKLTAQITAFQKDNLVNYLCDRKKIISLLERKLELNKDGKFANEDVVHDVIFPRKATTDEIRFEDHNLWLIDECIAFHAFAASEKPLSQTMHSSSDERPDILAFAEVGEDKVARAVSVVEFKKPQRKNFDEDPTRQIYRYVREIRTSQKVKLPNGRDLRVCESTRFYCYAICDLMPAVKEYCENNNYATLAGELGYYAYNRNHNAHTEVLDFDKLVIDAKRRHKAFFDKLGIA
jgi:hypothetical protein